MHEVRLKKIGKSLERRLRVAFRLSQRLTQTPNKP